MHSKPASSNIQLSTSLSTNISKPEVLIQFPYKFPRIYKNLPAAAAKNPIDPGRRPTVTIISANFQEIQAVRDELTRTNTYTVLPENLKNVEGKELHRIKEDLNKLKLDPSLYLENVRRSLRYASTDRSSNQGNEVQDAISKGHVDKDKAWVQFDPSFNSFRMAAKYLEMSQRKMLVYPAKTVNHYTDSMKTIYRAEEDRNELMDKLSYKTGFREKEAPAKLPRKKSKKPPASQPSEVTKTARKEPEIKEKSNRHVKRNEERRRIDSHNNDKHDELKGSSRSPKRKNNSKNDPQIANRREGEASRRGGEANRRRDEASKRAEMNRRAVESNKRANEADRRTSEAARRPREDNKQSVKVMEPQMEERPNRRHHRRKNEAKTNREPTPNGRRQRHLSEEARRHNTERRPKEDLERPSRENRRSERSEKMRGEGRAPGRADEKRGEERRMNSEDGRLAKRRTREEKRQSGGPMPAQQKAAEDRGVGQRNATEGHVSERRRSEDRGVVERIANEERRSVQKQKSEDRGFISRKAGEDRRQSRIPRLTQRANEDRVAQRTASGDGPVLEKRASEDRGAQRKAKEDRVQRNANEEKGPIQGRAGEVTSKRAGEDRIESEDRRLTRSANENREEIENAGTVRKVASAGRTDQRRSEDRTLTRKEANEHAKQNEDTGSVRGSEDIILTQRPMSEAQLRSASNYAKMNNFELARLRYLDSKLRRHLSEEDRLYLTAVYRKLKKPAEDSYENEECLPLLRKVGSEMIRPPDEIEPEGERRPSEEENEAEEKTASTEDSVRKRDESEHSVLGDNNRHLDRLRRYAGKTFLIPTQSTEEVPEHAAEEAVEEATEEATEEVSEEDIGEAAEASTVHAVETPTEVIEDKSKEEQTLEEQAEESTTDNPVELIEFLQKLPPQPVRVKPKRLIKKKKQCKSCNMDATAGIKEKGKIEEKQRTGGEQKVEGRQTVEEKQKIEEKRKVEEKRKTKEEHRNEEKQKTIEDKQRTEGKQRFEGKQKIEARQTIEERQNIEEKRKMEAKRKTDEKHKNEEKQRTIEEKERTEGKQRFEGKQKIEGRQTIEEKRKMEERRRTENKHKNEEKQKTIEEKQRTGGKQNIEEKQLIEKQKIAEKQKMEKKVKIEEKHKNEERQIIETKRKIGEKQKIEEKRETDRSFVNKMLKDILEDALDTAEEVEIKQHLYKESSEERINCLEQACSCTNNLNNTKVSRGRTGVLKINKEKKRVVKRRSDEMKGIKKKKSKDARLCKACSKETQRFDRDIHKENRREDYGVFRHLLYSMMQNAIEESYEVEMKKAKIKCKGCGQTVKSKKGKKLGYCSKCRHYQQAMGDDSSIKKGKRRSDVKKEDARRCEGSGRKSTEMKNNIGRQCKQCNENGEIEEVSEDTRVILGKALKKRRKSLDTITEYTEPSSKSGSEAKLNEESESFEDADEESQYFEEEESEYYEEGDYSEGGGEYFEGEENKYFERGQQDKNDEYFVGAAKCEYFEEEEKACGTSDLDRSSTEHEMQDSSSNCGTDESYSEEAPHDLVSEEDRAVGTEDYRFGREGRTTGCDEDYSSGAEREEANLEAKEFENENYRRFEEGDKVDLGRKNGRFGGRQYFYEENTACGTSDFADDESTTEESEDHYEDSSDEERGEEGLGWRGGGRGERVAQGVRDEEQLKDREFEEEKGENEKAIGTRSDVEFSEHESDLLETRNCSECRIGEEFIEVVFKKRQVERVAEKAIGTASDFSDDAEEEELYNIGCEECEEIQETTAGCEETQETIAASPPSESAAPGKVPREVFYEVFKEPSDGEETEKKEVTKELFYSIFAARSDSSKCLCCSVEYSRDVCCVFEEERREKTTENAGNEVKEERSGEASHGTQGLADRPQVVEKTSHEAPEKTENLATERAKGRNACTSEDKAWEKCVDALFADGVRKHEECAAPVKKNKKLKKQGKKDVCLCDSGGDRKKGVRLLFKRLL